VSSVHLPAVFTEKGVHFSLLPYCFVCIISAIFTGGGRDNCFPSGMSSSAII